MSFDSIILLGIILSGIAYGVAFTIGTFVLCMYSTGGYGTTFSWRPFMTCWLLLLATVSTALQVKWALLAFVTKQQDVSPSVFMETNINNRIYVMQYVFLSDM